MPSFTPLRPDALICTVCGTQYPETSPSARTTCFICDDPRQYVPPTGPSFTTLAALLSSPSGYRNVFTPLPSAPSDTLVSIHTEPKLGIGQRAILVRTPAGTVLWDCLTYLDAATVATIHADYGGLAAIVISHPHYYTTHVEWSAAFGSVPVYLSAEDRPFLALPSPAHQTFLTAAVTSIPPGVTALKLGGHFPGSLVLLHDGRLLVADTLMTTPAGLGGWDVDALGAPRPAGRPPGLNTYAFMWSIPNMIPLGADEVAAMWDVLAPHAFRSTHGAFVGQDVEGPGVKARVLESMKIQVRRMGYREHRLLQEEVQEEEV